MDEWESLCKRCGQCCFEKKRGRDGSLRKTSVPCRHLDIVERTCRIYEKRFEIDRDCIKLTPEKVRILSWLPEDCAYVRFIRKERSS